MPVTYRPQECRFAMLQGVPFHRELPIAYEREPDADGAGVPFDFTGWSAHVDLVDEDEELVIAFDTSGDPAGPVGLITLGVNGQVDLDLESAVTEDIVATVSVAGVIHSVHRGQFVFTSPDAAPYAGPRVVLEITRSPEP